LFTLNGQHTVKVSGDTASGILFSQIKMIREAEGKDILRDYSVKYEDEYFFSTENGDHQAPGFTIPCSSSRQDIFSFPP